MDCEWGEYGEWTPCTKTCDGGFQTRFRDVIQDSLNGGLDCEGESTDLRVCNEHACPGESNSLLKIDENILYGYGIDIC